MNTSTTTQTTRFVLRHSGHRHGPITRLMSPGDVGQLTKPFVFLDDIAAPAGGGPRFGFHPHSGIATLSVPLTFDIEHETSEGRVDHVAAGGQEWMQAGSGIWHKSQVTSTAPIEGYQLWLALPASHELAEPVAAFIAPEQVPTLGPAKLLLGSYEGQRSAVPAPHDANLFWVELAPGQSWHYTVPTGHSVLWLAAKRGSVHVAGETLRNELAVLAHEGTEPLHFSSAEGGGFLFGSAVLHPHELVLGNYSVHTSAEALEQGEARIREIGRGLRGR